MSNTRFDWAFAAPPANKIPTTNNKRRTPTRNVAGWSRSSLFHIYLFFNRDESRGEQNSSLVLSPVYTRFFIGCRALRFSSVFIRISKPVLSLLCLGAPGKIEFAFHSTPDF